MTRSSSDDGPSSGDDVRQKMIRGAVRLLATKGVEGTSFPEVLELTKTPRGSVYYHFPGGKSELLHAALDLAGEQGVAGLEQVRGEPALAVVKRFLALRSELLDKWKTSLGCAVLPVAIAPGDDELLDHTGVIFRSWTDLLSDLLQAGGLSAHSAESLALTVISATEGAVALCRAERTRKPFDEVSSVLIALTSNWAATA